MKFTSESMQEILPILQKSLRSQTTVSFDVLNPDLATQAYAGEIVHLENISYVYRGYKAWVDLAELLMCKMLTPKEGTYPFVKLTFVKLQTQNSFHLDTEVPREEKYGTHSHFAHINKMEEPAFLYYYEQALTNAKIDQRTRILNLGVNRGDEFEVIKNKLDTKKYESIELVGIDHSKSAIDYARALFPEKNVQLHVEDINNLDSLNLGRFDLLISIGTLQSPSINFKPFFMNLVQNHLTQDAAVILGFPNSRWVGGEMIYGAKAPNYAMSEMSLLYNDVMFAKKYLQQKKYRVTLTGKQYVFLVGTKIKVSF